MHLLWGIGARNGLFPIGHQAITQTNVDSLSIWYLGTNCGEIFEIQIFSFKKIYRQVSNIRRTLVGNKFVDHPDLVGASPVGAAPTTSSFST